MKLYLPLKVLIFCTLILRCFSAGIILCLSFSGSVSAQNDLKQGDSNKQNVKIEITTHLGDQQVFVENDLISFFISLDQAAYIYAFYKDASNNIFQILPSKAQPHHYFNAGYYMPFPAENSKFQFQVQAPFGREKLFLFATDQQHIKFTKKTAANDLMRLSVSQSEIERRIKSGSKALYGNAQIIIQTQMKSSY